MAISCVALALVLQQGQVGPVKGGTLLPTGHVARPLGEVLAFNGRPVDLALSPDGKLLFVKDNGGLRVVDIVTWKELQRVASPGGTSIGGIAVSAEGDEVYLTNAGNSLHEYTRREGGDWRLARSIPVPARDGKGASFPCGIKLVGKQALVALSLANDLAHVDLATGQILRRSQVGVAPFSVETFGGMAWVSDMGGRPAEKETRTAPSAGTPVVVDERGVAASGTLSVVPVARDLEGEPATVEIGLQPASVLALPARGQVAVACSNADTVAFVDARSRKVVAELVVKPDPKLPFGSMPTGLAASEDGRTLFVALSGSNAVAVVSLADARTPKVTGFIPTGGYPVALAYRSGTLYVANNKGWGSRSVVRDKKQGWNSHDHQGSVQRLKVPEGRALAQATETVRETVKLTHMLKAMERTGGSAATPRPIPARLGDPSVFKHVVYVIKENRTYDQMFGDIKEGDGDPSLCLFPEAITPNHHALAKEFVLLDNYYCNGVLSADGHSWATEGNVTPYLQRAFGGFGRSYTFGDDPITYSSSGFVWDAVLKAGLSFRNYGEFDYADPPQGMGFKQVYDAWKSGSPLEFRQNIGIKSLRGYSSRDYPGWNMNIPDVLRIDRFMKEFRQYEKDGDFPNFVIVYLPQDHASGTSPGMPTPRSHVADNDLAVGRLVEALSKSRFWKETVVFVNEDDPQAGFDHVDGHRSICLVVSPYSRLKKTVSVFYNQAAVLRTILHVFGIPPLNQQVASTNLMSACFGDRADLTPYTCREATVPLDELNPPATALTGEAKWYAVLSPRIPHERYRTAADDDLLNRILWFASKGDVPYPAHLAGAHGKGLEARGLRFGGEEHDDD